MRTVDFTLCDLCPDNQYLTIILAHEQFKSIGRKEKYEKSNPKKQLIKASWLIMISGFEALK